MFDPTIYENLKVVLEGSVYDHDLQGRIVITDRRDLIDLAKLSRLYIIRFRMRTQADAQREEDGADLSAVRAAVEAELSLSAGLTDLASEILAFELESASSPGCTLKLRWHLTADEPTVCRDITPVLATVWGEDSRITHRVSTVYDESTASRYAICSELDFGRKVNENQIEDFPSLVEHAVRSLRELSTAFGGK